MCHVSPLQNLTIRKSHVARSSGLFGSGLRAAWGFPIGKTSGIFRPRWCSLSKQSVGCLWRNMGWKKAVFLVVPDLGTARRLNKISQYYFLSAHIPGHAPFFCFLFPLWPCFHEPTSTSCVQACSTRVREHLFLAWLTQVCSLGWQPHLKSPEFRGRRPATFLRTFSSGPRLYSMWIHERYYGKQHKRLGPFQLFYRATYQHYHHSHIQAPQHLISHFWTQHYLVNMKLTFLSVLAAISITTTNAAVTLPWDHFFVRVLLWTL